MKYAIVCNLSGDVADYHKNLVRVIADTFGINFPLKQKFDPHFTLKYGFDVVDIEEIESVIERFCRCHTKTAIQVGGFASFRTDVIFLEVVLFEEARKVFCEFTHSLKEISWMTWREYEADQLKFHATIASHCSERHAEILEFLKGKEALFETHFDNITLLRESDVVDGIITWETYKIFEVQ